MKGRTRGEEAEHTTVCVSPLVDESSGGLYGTVMRLSGLTMIRRGTLSSEQL